MVTLFQGLVLWTKYVLFYGQNIRIRLRQISKKKGVYSRIMIGRGRRNKGRRVQQSKNSNKSNKVIQYTVYNIHTIKFQILSPLGFWWKLTSTPGGVKQ